ncbi:DUF2272 domain-containing protein [Siculibacillus lacustris]|uniref:DUF2272 domain-containing protein n=1 Tax=Siculibacillus lacustris TaxID=1549641 RepID=A0A4Q9VUH6_9HYPH|nr:CHAP domain-containing protein [Siculibacillus lacustris]TBW39793.1 DUF2272 domain-containing protein [Siculibacillus lacustris]
MILTIDDKGEDVRQLTAELVKLGFLASETPIFGAEVAKAVARFQASHVDQTGDPLVADGEAGPLTLWALADATSGAPTAAQVARPALTLPATGGSQSGRAALARALGEYARGAGEIGGNKLGIDVEAYQDHDRSLVGEPWCASFVSWCFDPSYGGAAPFTQSPSARSLWNDFRRRGWTYAPSDARPPEPGDVIFWWRQSPNGNLGHVGLVHSYAGGFLRTIEGNKGAYPAQVSTFTYVLGRIDQLLGFGQAQP